MLVAPHHRHDYREHGVLISYVRGKDQLLHNFEARLSEVSCLAKDHIGDFEAAVDDICIFDDHASTSSHPSSDHRVPSELPIPAQQGQLVARTATQ